MRSIFISLALLASFIFTPAQALDDTLEKLPFVKKLQLAKAGDPDAKMAVAEAYDRGRDAPQDSAKAAKWYREAALAGNVEAQFRLAKLVSTGAKGLSADKATAIKLLQAGAKQGHAPSQNLLGVMLQNGDGLPKDENAAVGWYQKAADQKLAAAQNNLGVMYLKGLGTGRDLSKAFAMFDAAAAQGESWALNNLGGMYEMGWGTAKSIDRAKTYYQQAADKGIAIAAKNLQRLGTAATTLPPKN